MDSIALGASRSRGGVNPNQVIALCQGGRENIFTSLQKPEGRNKSTQRGSRVCQGFGRIAKNLFLGYPTVLCGGVRGENENPETVASTEHSHRVPAWG